MILVILGICIAILGVGFIWFRQDEYGFGGPFTIAIGITGAIIALIATIILGVEVSNANVVDRKIVMYQEENTKIEQQIADIVTQYQNYETDIFTECKPDSAMTLVALYPELKSDTLVQEQIKIYTSNNQKIKELKEQEINGDVYRWWLYFGGSDKK